MAVTVGYSLAFQTSRGFDGGGDFQPLDVVALANGTLVLSEPGYTELFPLGQSDSFVSFSGSRPANAELSNGNVVVSRNGANGINWRVLTNTGGPVASGTAGVAGETISDVVGLKGAGAGFVIVDQTSGGDIMVHLRGLAGNVVADFAIDSSAATDELPTVAALADGGFAVAWDRVVGSSTQTWYAVYNGDGSVRKAPTLLDATGTINRDASATSLASGGFAFAYADNQFNARGVTLAIFDAAGTLKSSVSGVSSFYTNPNPSLVTLPNGALYLAVTGGSGGVFDPVTGAFLGNLSVGISFDQNSAIASGPLNDLVVGYSEWDDQGGDILTGVRGYHVVRTTTGDSGNNILTGDVLWDRMFGLNGNDTLTGLGGDDVLDGGGNADTMIGGIGNDTYVVDDPGDIVTEQAGEGTDTVQASTSYTLTANVENLVLLAGSLADGTGNDLDNTITGNALANQLDGAGGNDTLIGGLGNDTLIGGTGIDTASYAGAAAGVTVSLAIVGPQDTIGAGIDSLTGIENLTGSSLADRLTGDSGDNVLTGNGGADILEGGLGNDTLTGNTVSYASAAGAVTVNLATVGPQDTGAAGLDTISALSVIGSAFADTLTGNSNGNTLDGGAGADTMTGGLGNDTYVVDDPNDVVVEQANEGTDTVTTAASYTLGDNIENLVLLGTGNFNGTGNGLGNVLTGNAGNNTLDGAGGIDTASYAAATASVTVSLALAGAQNTGGAGIDTLVQVENLDGSAFADTLTGDAGNNILSGGAGDDILEGGAGNDTIRGGGFTGSGFDTASYAHATSGVTVRIATSSAQDTGGAGIDTLISISRLIGSSFDDTLRGGGNWTGFMSVVEGGLGNDTLIGTGPDIASYASAQGGVTVNLAITTGQDTGAAGIDTLTNIGSLIGSAFDDVLTGKSGANTLTGGAGNDTLDGGAGNDQLIGGIGDDTYVVDVVPTGSSGPGDYITELANEGIDTVYTAFSYTLGANLENLFLTGTGSVSGTGNELSNRLNGNDGDNLLTGLEGNDKIDGKLGADNMRGGLGDDLYTVDNAGDRVRENAGEGIDTVRSFVTLTLAANVENLQLQGTDNLNGTGNDLANVLSGNAGNNILDGKAGADTMNGGAGDDTYVVDDPGDVVADGANQGNDTVKASVSTVMANNIETLILTGSANLNGTGNNQANSIEGNNGNNILDGKGGVDVLHGGWGDDTYYVDDAGDTVTESNGQGTDTVISTISFILANNVENLTLVGGARLSGTGNGLANVLIGNGANNVLDGQKGNDTLIGGGSNDTFAFSTKLDALTNVDTLADFVSGSDKLALSQSIFSTLSLGALASTAFVQGAAAMTAAQRIVYDATTGLVSYDKDGSGSSAAIAFAQLTPGQALTYKDFLVV